MSNRGTLRRKVVLPVSIIRRGGEEKQLAHTLDVTEFSARLGGLGVLLEPGEVIEVQRGAVRAKFQVHWMGAPGDPLAGQAGIRGIDTNRSIWGVQLPPDQPDVTVDHAHLRNKTSVLNSAGSGAQFDPNIRYECSGAASLRAPGSNYAVRAQVRHIHLSGLYLETITTFPLNTVLNLELKLEGVLMEAAGVVTASTQRIGMDIAFHKILPETRRKIVQILQKLKQKAWDAQQIPAFSQISPALPFAPRLNEPKAVASLPDLDPCRLLVTLCQTVASDFDGLISARSETEIEELKNAVTALQKRLSSTNHSELALATFVPESRRLNP